VAVKLSAFWGVALIIGMREEGAATIKKRNFVFTPLLCEDFPP